MEWIHIKDSTPNTTIKILVWDEIHKECCICYNLNGKWLSHYGSHQIDFKWWMTLPPHPPSLNWFGNNKIQFKIPKSADLMKDMRVYKSGK